MKIKCQKCGNANNQIHYELPDIDLDKGTFVYPLFCGKCLTYVEVYGKVIVKGISGGDYAKV